MIKCYPIIDALNQLLGTEKHPLSSEFVETILKAFVNGEAFDTAGIKNFLKLFTATENFVSQVAKLSKKAFPFMMCAAVKI